MARNIKHIAVIRLSAMGDVAMTVPVLKAFANAWPDVKITIISKPMFAEFFTGIPNVSFFAFDANGRHRNFFGLIRLFRELKNLNVDAYADLHNVIRTKIIGFLFALSGIRTATVDKARSEKKALTRKKNKVFRQLKPIAQRHAEVFAALGFPIVLNSTVEKTRLHPDREVENLTGAKQQQKWVGIAPFAQHDSKIYPADLMQQVIDDLARDENVHIFLFGGSQEIEKLQEFKRNHNNVIIASAVLTFKHELQLISNLDLMLSMDSGNAHIAAMYGVSVITLWGATHPFSGFAPFGQPMGNTITADRTQYPLIPTSVYGNKVVAGYQDAMRTISPIEIVAKIESLLLQ